jgi:hypothetical protein
VARAMATDAAKVITQDAYPMLAGKKDNGAASSVMQLRVNCEMGNDVIYLYNLFLGLI